MQVAETPDKETQGDKQPELAPPGPSSRVTATMVSLSALAIIGAATANSLPSFDRLSLPSFSVPSLSVPSFSMPNFSMPSFSWPSFSWPSFDRLSLPKLDRLALPNFDRFSAPLPPKQEPPPQKAAAPIPDPVVTAALKDIQSSQQQNAAALVSLTQGSSTQAADLKRISRQITALATQVEGLQEAITPLTTSSIANSNARGRGARASRKTIPPLPKPVGPVSVGGAPLSPTPRTGA